jgi:hypothetical protein
MSFLELAGFVLGSAGLFASILGAWLLYAARYNRNATRELIREMNKLAEDRHQEMSRMAEERHSDTGYTGNSW